MIKISEFGNLFNREEMVSEEDFKDICNILFKNREIDDTNKLYFYNYLSNNNFDIFRNYSVLKKQLTVNEVLQKIMDTVNEDNDTKINPFKNTKIGSVVNDPETLKEKLIEVGVDSKDFDVENYSLDELRDYLYRTVGLKSKSIVDYYNNYVTSELGHRGYRFDIALLIEQGINPDCIVHEETKPYIDRQFLEDNLLLTGYLKDGEVLGKKIMKQDRKKRK